MNDMVTLKPDKYYHIFNHAIGNRDIFKTEKNYNSFLRKYEKYISPVAATMAFCLLKDHFHLLIRVKDLENISDVSKAFKKLFKSYTKAINRETGRKEKIFDTHFKPKRVSKNKRIQATFNFIHLNPIFHELCEYPGEWKYSSFNAYIENKDTTFVCIVDGKKWFVNLKNIVSNLLQGKVNHLIDTF